jgi:2,4-dienoyl-CoA reductase-like NADH-dependent reductase (Old Yellow Enzyme family)
MAGVAPDYGLRGAALPRPMVWFMDPVPSDETFTMPTPSVFDEFALPGLTLRNRAVRSGCFEGLSQGGLVTDRLIEHHRRVAAGGVGMTTLSYCSVSEDGRAFGHELWMRPEILPGLEKFTRAVHAEGAAASLQLGHCGFFASPSVIGRRPLGASPKFCLFRLSVCREMTQCDIDEKTADFANAALMARGAGFDAVELHAGHGYLLSQFLSPWTNHRDDRYGGALGDRLRFPTEVVAAVRAALGPDFPILVKMNVRDGWRGGLEVDEAAQVAKAFENAGATALVPSCGFTARTPLYMLRGGVPVKEMVKAQEGALTKIGMTLFGRIMVQHYRYGECFLLEEARRIRDAVTIPVGYIGGVESLAQMESLVADGFAFVQLGRATVRDPDFVRRVQSGEIEATDCDHCNRCVASMSHEGIRCYCAELPAASGADL